MAVWAGCVRFSGPCAAAKLPRRRRRCGPVGVGTSSERPASPGYTDWTTAVSITFTRAAALPAAASAWDRAAARQLRWAPWRGDRGGEGQLARTGAPCRPAEPAGVHRRPSRCRLRAPSRAQWAPTRAKGARVTTRKRATGRRSPAVVHHPYHTKGAVCRSRMRRMPPGLVTAVAYTGQSPVSAAPRVG